MCIILNFLFLVILLLVYVILSVNETWLDDSVTDDEVAIPGFTIFRNDRMSGRHGGVALYVRYHKDKKKKS